MKTTRFALLVLLIGAVAAVVGGYIAAERRNLLRAPAKPAPIPKDLHSIANNWSWSQSSKDHAMVEAHARDFRQVKDSMRFQLGEVELKVFSKAGDTYNLIRSKQAEFDQEAERLYSEGEVTIVLHLPADSAPEPGKRYVEIQTSGLTYDNKTGVSSTDRPARFKFENGDGRSIGAVYDSSKRFLWLKKDPEIIGAGPQKGMRIQAGELTYYEAEQKIDLRPWSKMERGGQGVEAGSATVYLQDGNLKRVEAQQGKGWDISPGREMRFHGNELTVNFTPQQTVGNASGAGGAEVISQSASGTTKAAGDRIDLEFTTPPGGAESELAQAFVRGHGRVESLPAASAEHAPPESKIVTAEVIQVQMRPGGQDLQTLTTHAAGRLDFLPNQPTQWKRSLTAERMTAQYLPGNHPESLRAVGKVLLRSDPPASGVKPSAAAEAGAAAGASAAQPPPRLTWSDDLAAFFEPETGQMRELRQWNHFRYEEGARKAQAGEARFDVANDRVTFDTGARVWDDVSLTTANRLVLDQKLDHLHAEGNVTSTHQEAAGNSKPPKGSAAGADSGSLFTPDKPVHATAQVMDSDHHNHLLHYRGSARLWQDGNSIQAQEIDLDREKKVIQARKSVINVLVEDQDSDRPAGAAKAQSAALSNRPSNQNQDQVTGARMATVTSDSLVYTDDDRRAVYTGQVQMRRERMIIRAAELQAFLRPQDQVEHGESRIEHAVAQGKVEILEAAADRRSPRKGSADHAEYFSGQEKVILRGGTPTLEQQGQGSTKGGELTYYIDDDRLQVNGQPGARSQTRKKIKHN